MHQMFLLPSDIYYQDDSIEEACNCFHPCEEVKYTVSQSAAAFPNQYVSPFLEATRNQDTDFFK